MLRIVVPYHATHHILYIYDVSLSCVMEELLRTRIIEILRRHLRYALQAAGTKDYGIVPITLVGKCPFSIGSNPTIQKNGPLKRKELLHYCEH